MSYTPEQIAAHIAKRAAAVGENSADVRILRQLVAALEPFAQVAKHHAADAPEWGPFDSVRAVISIQSLRACLSTQEQAQ